MWTREWDLPCEEIQIKCEKKLLLSVGSNEAICCQLIVNIRQRKKGLQNIEIQLMIKAIGKL